MGNAKILYKLIPAYILVFALFMGAVFGFSKTATVMSENLPIKGGKCVVIDAGHGGIDGGAVSASATKESDLNLQIALRLNDLFHLLGVHTKMIRSTDISVYTNGSTIAQKKISDLKERVRMVNQEPNCLLLSLHMNYFSDDRYSGAQVFYPNTKGSKELAQLTQKSLVSTLNPGSNRKSKACSGVYLMQNIKCTGILVECGFLSNPAEEYRLKTAEYQQQICCVLASTVSNFMSNT